MGFPWGFKSLARHQENSAGSVVWALPNFLGVWCIEPPRGKEREEEYRPRVIRADTCSDSCPRGQGSDTHVFQSASLPSFPNITANLDGEAAFSSRCPASG